MINARLTKRSLKSLFNVQTKSLSNPIERDSHHHKRPLITVNCGLFFQILAWSRKRDYCGQKRVLETFRQTCKFFSLIFKDKVSLDNRCLACCSNKPSFWTELIAHMLTLFITLLNGFFLFKRSSQISNKWGQRRLPGTASINMRR